jgi:hypothetical protein
MTVMTSGQRVALAGGGEGLRALALAARDLKEGRRTTHPELLLFPAWGDLLDYAAHDPAGRDLQPLVDLVDKHGTDAILNAVDGLAPEQHAEVTVSTAHKAKGREWDCVRIADDFTPPRNSDQKDDNGCALPRPIDESEARLAYVAVTRNPPAPGHGRPVVDRPPPGRKSHSRERGPAFPAAMNLRDGSGAAE